MSLRFVPLGIGDAFSQKSYSSCLAVTAEGGALLVDCPHPIRKMLFEVESYGERLDVGDFDAVVLTHLHADHSSGIEGYLYYSRYCLNKSTTIAAHRAVLDRLWEGHLAAGMDELEIDGVAQRMSLSDYADTAVLSEGASLRVGPFQIECRRTTHQVPTFALKIRADESTLAYSADTGFDPGLIEWMRNADLIIHETNKGIHTPYEKLAALPRELREKMRLIHFPDDFDAASSVIGPLVQGREYQVG